MLDRAHYTALGLADVYDCVLNGDRISIEQGQRLFDCADIHAIGALAHHARTIRHGNSTFYVLNRHINYTNVCVNGCLFCAFHREEDQQQGAFTMTHDEVLDKLTQEDALAATEVHIVGGCHPRLPLSFFEELLTKVHERRPDLTIKGFTCVEIAHFAKLENISTTEVLTRLKAAGLAMLPGGGAEIFAEHVREKICPKKLASTDWLRVAEEAHTLGIPTNCTMLYGHAETTADRLDHLDRLRTLQDRTNGFVCFIPLPFQSDNNELGLDDCRGVHSGLDDLKTIAISRLMLDNIPHIKAYWVMLTVKLAQTALYFGADDLDGTVLEEKIGHMAGAQSEQALSRTELEHMITNAGFTPVLRDSTFNPLEQEGN